MKKIVVLLSAICCLATVAPVQAQSNGVYRCGNEYTNDTKRIRQGDCVAVTGGNLTVVRGSSFTRSSDVASVRRARATSRDMANTPRQSGMASESGMQQRVRDQGMRNILQAELDRANGRLADLRREYNNGEPEKVGPEFRNHQKYLDRVAELKANIARTESDIASLRRELERAGG